MSDNNVPQSSENAPEFSTTDDQGNVFSLSDYRGERVLLVFYPGDDTPVCTRQLCDYRDGIESFAGLGVTVVGISPDDAASHRAFKQKHGLPFVLLSDPDLEVAGLYGVRSWAGGMKRAVFLIDERGVVQYGHVESVAVFRRKRDELLDVIQALDAA